MICKNCGKKLRDGVQFCGYCGFDFRQSDVNTKGVAQRTNICPSCGKSLPVGVSFCGYCGSNVQQSIVKPEIFEGSVVPVTCQKCGSNKLNKTGNDYVCEYCHTIHRVVEPKIKYENHVHYDNASSQMTESLNVYKIADERTKKDFMRAALIDLYRSGVPIGILKTNESDVTKQEVQMLVSSLYALVSYQAELEDDRKEPFIEIIDCIEREPYTELVREYNYDTKQWEQVPYTRHRNVTRQKQVTNVRTVTDRHHASGTNKFDWTTVLVNSSNQEVPRPEVYVFLESLKSIKNKDIKRKLSSNDAYLEPKASDKAYKNNVGKLKEAPKSLLHADRITDYYSSIVNITDKSNTIFFANVYFGEIPYDGGKILKCAFPFGDMAMNLNPIIKDKDKEELNSYINDKQEEIKQIEKDLGKKGVYISGAVALASLVIMLILKVSFIAALIIACFVLVIVMAVYGYLVATKEMQSQSEPINKQIDTYKSNFKEKKLKDLNDKLLSLGLEAVKNTDNITLN